MACDTCPNKHGNTVVLFFISVADNIDLSAAHEGFFNKNKSY